MATVQSASSPDRQVHTLNVVQVLVAGGLTASIVFLLCWVGAFLPYTSPTHAYIGLFTTAEYTSERALAEGLLVATLWRNCRRGIRPLLQSHQSAR
jgi:hypothetical protein